MSLPILNILIMLGTQNDGCLENNLMSLPFLNIYKMLGTQDDGCLAGNLMSFLFFMFFIKMLGTRNVVIGAAVILPPPDS